MDVPTVKKVTARLRACSGASTPVASGDLPLPAFPALPALSLHPCAQSSCLLTEWHLSQPCSLESSAVESSMGAGRLCER